MCIQSFLSHGHTVDLYTYAPDLNAPSGCTVLDAGEIFPEAQVITYQTGRGKGSVALFSDMFRYGLLVRKPGWWVDLDVVCLSDALPDTDYVFGYQDALNTIGTAVLKVPPGDHLTRRCLIQALQTGSKAVWGQIGPDLLTEQAKLCGLSHHISPRSLFYPFGWTEAMDALDPDQTERLLVAVQDSKCCHLWNEMLRRDGVDKWQRPPPGSLLDVFFNRYGP